MKKNITLCLSLMILVLVCCGITINLVQKADKNTSSQSVMAIVTEKSNVTISMKELVWGTETKTEEPVVCDDEDTDEFINTYTGNGPLVKVTVTKTLTSGERVVNEFDMHVPSAL